MPTDAFAEITTFRDTFSGISSKFVGYVENIQPVTYFDTLLKECRKLYRFRGYQDGNPIEWVSTEITHRPAGTPVSRVVLEATLSYCGD